MRPRDTRQRALQFSEDRTIWASMPTPISQQVVDVLRQLMLQAFRRWLEVRRDH